MAAPPAMAYKYLPPNGLNLEIKPAVEKAIVNPSTRIKNRPVPSL